jgi:hypothetical protein
MEEIILSALRQFGFSAALCILLLYGCYRLLIWVMTQAANREAVLMAMIKEQTQALNTHTEQAKDFHNEVRRLMSSSARSMSS